MSNKISDFKIAESIIRKLCKKYEVNFVDVLIDFEDNIDGLLFIGNTKNIAHSIFKIIAEYINKSFDITGVQFMSDKSRRDDFLTVLAANLRGFIYGNDVVDKNIEEPYITRLYQCPLIWVIMKDIICPIYKKELTNIKLICADDPKIDIAKYYSKEEIPSDDISEDPFIFVNMINNREIKDAFIFIEALRAHDLSPIEVIKNIYETNLYDKFQGLLKIALDDEDANNIECTIMAIMGIDFYSLMSRKTAQFDDQFIKTAQNSVSGLPNQFWFIGILEKMMESARKPDWSTYKNLEPYVKEFWDKVEEVRQARIKKGHDSGVPFDVLLRIKSKQTVDYETDPTRTLQDLLSSDRIW